MCPEEPLQRFFSKKFAKQSPCLARQGRFWRAHVISGTYVPTQFSL